MKHVNEANLDICITAVNCVMIWFHRGLINKGAALYEKKRMCEAERKRRERNANTNGSPDDSMTLICSICNRQFRAKIGRVSH